MSGPQSDPMSRVAYVTGAGSGIGAAVCRRLARDGVALAAVDRDPATLVALRAELGDAAAIETAVLDVRDEPAQRTFLDAAQARLGPLTDAVPCAGLARSGPAEAMTLQDWSLVLDVNLTGSFIACKLAGQAMLAQRRGAIVCIASITGKGGQPGRINYAASKWGLIGMVKTLATEWSGRGVRVNAVAPNGVDTPLLSRGVPAHFRDDVMLDRTPMGRFAKVEEIAETIAFLLSGAASYVTGAVLEVDGGLTAGFLTHRHGADHALHDAPPPSPTGDAR